MALTAADLERIGANLERHFESVRAVVPGDDNRFKRALDSLRELAVAENLSMAIVGGMAAIHHGYPAATRNIDVVVGRGDLDRLLWTAPNYGIEVVMRVPAGWHTLMFEDVEILVVPEAGRFLNSAPTTVPAPAELGVLAGMEFASFSGWIELKLSRGRRKDLVDVIETLKKVPAEMVEQARLHLQQVAWLYFEQFEELYLEAMEEKKQELERGRPGHRGH